MAGPTTMRCGVGGKEYPLTADYIAQYGGQSTQCDCGAAIVVPGVSATPGPGAKPVRAWRDGEFVVVERGAKLPRRCFKCGEPVTNPMKQIVLDFSPGKMMPRGVFGMIHNAIADTYGHSIVVRYGRCPAHRTWLNKHIFLATFAVLAAISLFVAIWNPSPEVTIIAAFFLMLAAAGAVIAFRWGSPLSVVQFEKNRAWVKGF